MYDTVEQASMRLRQTIVLYDGKPVQVIDATTTPDGEVGINISPLPRLRDAFLVPLSDPKLNIYEFRLGYVNAFNYAGYMTRMMGRQQRQGLCAQNVKLDQEFHKATGRTFGHLVPRPEFSDALQGIYPSFQQCVEQLSDPYSEVRSLAFSRRFALYRDHDLGYFELRYRGGRVAWGDPASFNLPSEFGYLSELIQEQGISVR